MELIMPQEELKDTKNKLIFWFWSWIICTIFTGIFYRIPLILPYDSALEWNLYISQRTIQVCLQLIVFFEYISLILTIMFVVKLLKYFVEKENKK